MTDQERITAALKLASDYGTIDGDHHKMWVIDQMVRQLAPDYDVFVAEHEEGGLYAWDTGIEP